MVHAINPSNWEEEASRLISEFDASLVHRVSSRTARTTQRNPVSKNKKTKTKQNKIRVGAVRCLSHKVHVAQA